MRLKWLIVFVIVSLCEPRLIQAEEINIDHISREIIRNYLAQEQPPQTSTIERKEKSYGLAMALGFSPIPGDGLYYTGHPVQGTLSLLLGGLGGWFYTEGVLNGCGRSNDSLCRGLKRTFTNGGAVLYFSSYLWDVIGTTISARKYKLKPPQLSSEPTQILESTQKPTPTTKNPDRLKKIQQIDLTR